MYAGKPIKIGHRTPGLNPEFGRPQDRTIEASRQVLVAVVQGHRPDARGGGHDSVRSPETSRHAEAPWEVKEEQ